MLYDYDEENILLSDCLSQLLQVNSARAGLNSCCRIYLHMIFIFFFGEAMQK